MPVKADQDRQRPPRIIGTRPPRHDGVDKVTGRALFGADLKPAGTLYGKILRSPHAHARIVSLDATPALSVPGVYAVVTSADLPPPEKRVVELGHGSFDVRDARENTLASGKVRYCGQPVAAVAATSLQIAEQAIRQIEVAYEPLPAVFDVRAAMSEGAPLVQEDLFTSDTDGRASTPSNVAGHVRFEKGDVEEGFRTADRVFHARFTTGLVHQGYLEPQVATALWGADDTLTVWCSTQGGFSAQAQTAEVLEESRFPGVKVVPMEVGGAFGGKIGIYLKPVAALLSPQVGKAGQDDHGPAGGLRGHGTDPGLVSQGAARCDENWPDRRRQSPHGIRGRSVRGIQLCRSHADHLRTVLVDIEHVVIDGYDVLVNKPRTAGDPGSLRHTGRDGLRDPDRRSGRVGRRRSARFAGSMPAREGTGRVDGETFPRIGYEETSPRRRHVLTTPARSAGRTAAGAWHRATGSTSACSLA